MSMYTRPDSVSRFARLSRWQRATLVASPLAVIVAGVSIASLGHTEAAAPATPLPTVTVATPLVREVSEWDTYVGRFAPSQAVDVRPRVSGAVVAIHFHDGEIVRKGQALFTIDPRPFEAALEEAQAAVESARSALALARSDLARAVPLAEVKAVSVQEVDTLRARVQAAEATLAASSARVHARALDVEFTEVRAPLTGRVSDRRVDVGNLVGVEGANATLLTTVNALDPIYFTFDASEALYLKSQRARRKGATASPVEIRLQDETDYRWKGQLDFTDNGLDPRSGTIRGRASLSNPDYFLTPGMFGNMRLANGSVSRALLIPDAAVQTDQARKNGAGRWGR
jgi:RND family efflux transporter MFP subunit